MPFSHNNNTVTNHPNHVNLQHVAIGDDAAHRLNEVFEQDDEINPANG